LLNPYNYITPDEGVSFHFITKNNITYSLALSDYSELFGVPSDCSCRLVFVVLTPINPPETIPLDLRVKDTVVSFLIEYLTNHPDVVFYVCSEKDNKEIKRQAAFSRWFTQHRPEHIVREMKIVDGSNTYFLFHRGNELVNSVLTMIDEYNKMN
jgi:hypothetical protein